MFQKKKKIAYTIITYYKGREHVEVEISQKNVEIEIFKLTVNYLSKANVHIIPYFFFCKDL